MKPKIETLAETKLVGTSMMMSFSDNNTFDLWRSFMPRRKEIQNGIGMNLYSIEVYSPLFWNSFNPKAKFKKWAAIAVTDFGMIPDGMEAIVLPEGLYAVFVHRGPASTAPKTYQYIFETWLPSSEFSLDIRPHFALMGPKYRNDAPDSEEEIWIPIKPR